MVLFRTQPLVRTNIRVGTLARYAGRAVIHPFRPKRSAHSLLRWWVILASVVALCLGTTESVPVAAQSQGYTPVYEEADCTFADNGADQPSKTCGYLTVPEDRAQPAGAQVRLAVVILHAEASDPRPDPIVYLAGGPGQSATTRPASHFEALRAQRDVILIDQRGTGRSHPNLACPEVDLGRVMELHLTEGATAAYALYSAGLTDCRDRLTAEGINLAAYTSADSAADIADLRVALGIERWNLLGVSYGSRVAQTVMRDHPDGVRSVTLDSVLPVEVNFTADRSSRTFDAVTALTASCAADAACEQAYPHLEDTLVSLVTRLEQDPLMLKVTSPRTRALVEIPFDGRMVYDMLYSMLYTTEIIPALPQVIAAMDAGDFSVANLHASRLFGPNLGIGMYVNVYCAEETNLTTLEQALANISLSPTLEPLFLADIQDELRWAFTQCELWGVPAADPIENDPVISPIPTLILNGALDPVTPPAYAQMVHEHLPNSFYFEFPAIGHTAVFSSTCAAEMTSVFLNDPTTAPQHDCFEAVGPPEFITDEDA